MNSPAKLSQTYFLGADHEGRQIVSVHVKRTYGLMPNGRCVIAEKQGPLLTGPDPDEPDDGFSETDIVPFKRTTDLIVMANAWARGTSRVTAGIRVGDRHVQYLVQGDRRVIYRGKGSWTFSAPDRFEALGMCHERAYGGFDDAVPDPPVEHMIDLFQIHPGHYPRNPVGRGYAVVDSPGRLDGLPLPNIEHPQMLLTPERLVTGDPGAWWRQPLPWSCEWFDKMWFPRMLHYRAVPPGLPDDDSEVPEVKLGFIEPGYARRVAASKLEDPWDDRLADAAAPALVMPTMRGDEQIELTAMTSSGKMIVQLPGDRPRVQIRDRGKLHEVPVVPHRILISTIEFGVYVVWHAAWPTPRHLPERMPREGDSPGTLLEGIEAFVDNQRIDPLAGAA